MNSPGRLTRAAVVVAAAATLVAGGLPWASTAAEPRPATSGRVMLSTGGTPSAGEQHLVTLVNRARARQGVGPVRYSPTMSRQAHPWARMLAGPRWRGRLAHSPTYWSGIRSACRAASAGAENVAGRYEVWQGGRQELARRAARGLLRQYRNSPPHRANLLNRQATHIGVATVVRRTSPGHFYAANVIRFARAASC